MSQARAAEASLGAKPARLSFEVNVDVVCPKCRLVVLAGTRHDCEGEGALRSFQMNVLGRMESFEDLDARIKAEVRRDEIDEGVVIPNPRDRYCPMCETWSRRRVCKACGMDTEKAE